MSLRKSLSAGRTNCTWRSSEEFLNEDTDFEIPIGNQLFLKWPAFKDHSWNFGNIIGWKKRSKGYDPEAAKISAQVFGCIPMPEESLTTGGESIGELCQMLAGQNITGLLKNSCKQSFSSIFGPAIKKSMPEITRQLAIQAFGLLWNCMVIKSVEKLVPIVCAQVTRTIFKGLNLSPKTQSDLDCVVRQCLTLIPQLGKAGKGATDALAALRKSTQELTTDAAVDMANEGAPPSQTLPFLQRSDSIDASVICQIFKCAASTLQKVLDRDTTTAEKRQMALDVIKMITKLVACPKNGQNLCS